MQTGPNILTANKKVLIDGSNAAKPRFIELNLTIQILGIKKIKE